MRLICTPKFCISIVFNFSLDGCDTQKKWGGGGDKWEMWKFIIYVKFMGNVEVANDHNLMEEWEKRMIRKFKSIIILR